MTNRKNGSDKRGPETIDAATGTPDPTPRRIDLSSLRDVRLEMAAVYRRLDGAEIETHEATRRVYILGEIAKVITVAELERRILELEERQQLGLSGGTAALPYRSAGAH
jgi:hypothetical protein